MYIFILNPNETNPIYGCDFNEVSRSIYKLIVKGALQLLMKRYG